MAAEAGVLGVPFVRFNDFVGRIGYLRELEDTYHLGFGIKASASGSVDQLCSRVEELVSMPSAERKATFAARRQQMLSDKIDCAEFEPFSFEFVASDYKTYKFSFEHGDQDHVTMTESDGTVWSCDYGYCFGAGFED